MLKSTFHLTSSHRKPLKKSAFSRISSSTCLSLDLAFTHTVTVKSDLILIWGSSVKTLSVVKVIKVQLHLNYIGNSIHNLATY